MARIRSTKYKKGDVVVVRSDLVAGRSYDGPGGRMNFVSGMTQFRGKSVKIRSLTSDNCFYYIEGCLALWSDDMFECLESDLYSESISADSLMDVLF